LVAISLGSNLGDREANLELARKRLRTLLTGYRASSAYETHPVGVPGPQPLFLNAAVVGSTELAPRALLDTLLDIEREALELAFPGAARTLISIDSFWRRNRQRSQSRDPAPALP
jgi:2-amino-4-hydroxy-6-hydroxymethyldihydropteridine diphosphokinase